MTRETEGNSLTALVTSPDGELQVLMMIMMMMETMMMIQVLMMMMMEMKMLLTMTTMTTRKRKPSFKNDGKPDVVDNEIENNLIILSQKNRRGFDQC